MAGGMRLLKYIKMRIKLMGRQERRLSSEASFKSINQSQTNCSVSKQTHSFSKSCRFPALKPQCPLISYNGDTIHTKASGASIGVGKKSDFTKDLTCSPGCNKYLIKSKLENDLSLQKGFSVGKGRDEVVFSSYINRELLRTPTANRYQVNHEAVKIKNPLFSMGSRTKLLNKSMTIDPQNNNPGPGDYANSWGLQNKSQSANIRFSADKSQRFPNYDNRIPGPATYNQVSSLSKVGKYSISQHPGSVSPKFSLSQRRTEFDEVAKKSKDIPGAGSYRAPSQFGQYDEPFAKLNRLHIPSLYTPSQKMRKAG